MKLISRQEKANRVAERWKEQYYQRKIDEWTETRIGDTERTYKAIVALGNNPIPDEIDKIIGNGSWTRLTCDECGEDKEAVIQMGQEPDYESHTACVCWNCLDKIKQLTRASS